MPGTTVVVENFVKTAPAPSMAVLVLKAKVETVSASTKMNCR